MSTTNDETATGDKDMGKVSAYKAFGKDMTCRGFQYEVGKTYYHDGDVEPCVAGFHACELPLSVLTYYPVDSLFASVEVYDPVYEDNKLVTNEITIKEIKTLEQMVHEQSEKICEIEGNFSKGDKESLLNTGYCQSVHTFGDYSDCITTGNGSTASTSGDVSHAITNGCRSPAVTSGFASHAVTFFGASVAITTARCSFALAMDHCGCAVAMGRDTIVGVLGSEGRAKTGKSGGIVLAYWEGDCLKHFRAAVIGGPEGIKPDTWYELSDEGEFIACGGDQNDGS